MSARNNVQLIGNLGADPELKEFEGGSSICEFSVATTEVYKNKEGEKTSNTEWHNVIAWNTLGVIISKNFKKGSSILINGSIHYQNYEKDGIKRRVTKIKANSFEFLGAKPKDETSVTPKDDLPF